MTYVLLTYLLLARSLERTRSQYSLPDSILFLSLPQFLNPFVPRRFNFLSLSLSLEREIIALPFLVCWCSALLRLSMCFLKLSRNGFKGIYDSFSASVRACDAVIEQGRTRNAKVILVASLFFFGVGK